MARLVRLALAAAATLSVAAPFTLRAEDPAAGPGPGTPTGLGRLRPPADTLKIDRQHPEPRGESRRAAPRKRALPRGATPLPARPDARQYAPDQPWETEFYVLYDAPPPTPRSAEPPIIATYCVDQ